MANEILGAKSYLVLETESTWGTTPGSTWVHMPVHEYSVKFRPERRNSVPFLGLRQRKHGKNFRGMPSGTLRTSLFGQVDSGASVSLAQYLLDWALANPETQTRPSKSAQWAEGPGVADKAHTGLRVNQLTLSGSEDSGFVEVALDLMGKSDAVEGSIETLPTDREKIQEMEFFDCTFALAGSSVNLASFQYVVNHNLKPYYLNSYTPTLIEPGGLVETLQFTLIKNAATYDAYRRATTATEVTGQIVCKGLHNGTGSGSNTIVTIDFDRLSYVNHDDQVDFNSLTKIPLQFDVLKPDSSSNGITITYSDDGP